MFHRGEMVVQIVEHALLAVKVSELRNKDISPAAFRSLLNEITSILAVHASRDIPVVPANYTAWTPLAEYTPLVIPVSIGLFPILRAGIGMTESMLKMFPLATVHHIGLYREKSTFLPVEYYNKLPANCNLQMGFVLDPMIATAGTAIAAVNILKDWGLQKIVFIGVVTSQSGLDALRDAHPDIEIYVACVDDELTDKKYIIPGLGDVGDRQFNTH